MNNATQQHQDLESSIRDYAVTTLGFIDCTRQQPPWDPYQSDVVDIDTGTIVDVVRLFREAAFLVKQSNAALQAIDAACGSQPGAPNESRGLFYLTTTPNGSLRLYIAVENAIAVLPLAGPRASFGWTDGQDPH